MSSQGSDAPSSAPSHAAVVEALNSRIRSLEADLRLRDAEIAKLRKPRPVALDRGADDRYRRPYDGR